MFQTSTVPMSTLKRQAGDFIPAPVLAEVSRLLKQYGIRRVTVTVTDRPYILSEGLTAVFFDEDQATSLKVAGSETVGAPDESVKAIHAELPVSGWIIQHGFRLGAGHVSLVNIHPLDKYDHISARQLVALLVKR